MKNIFKNIVVGINILFIIFIVLLAFWGSSKLNFGLLALILYPALNLFCISFLSKRENHKILSFVVVAFDFIAFIYLLVGSLFGVMLGSALGGKLDGGFLLLAFLISLPAFINFIYFYKKYFKREEAKEKINFSNKSNLFISLLIIIIISIVFFTVMFINNPKSIQYGFSSIGFIIIAWFLLILPIYNYIESQNREGKQLKSKIITVIFLISALGLSTTILFYASFIILFVVRLILIFKPSLLFKEENKII